MRKRVRNESRTNGTRARNSRPFSQELEIEGLDLNRELLGRFSNTSNPDRINVKRGSNGFFSAVTNHWVNETVSESHGNVNRLN